MCTYKDIPAELQLYSMPAVTLDPTGITGFISINM